MVCICIATGINQIRCLMLCCKINVNVRNVYAIPLNYEMGYSIMCQYTELSLMHGILDCTK